MGNKPLIVIADDEDQESDSIFGSESFLSERSSLLNSQRSVSNQSEIVDFLLRKSVRDPPMKMKKKIYRNASFADDGQASWTLQQQQEVYKEA